MSDIQHPLQPTLILHKPSGAAWNEASQLIVPETRASIDRSGIDLLEKPFKNQHCVTPLETGAEGLIVFTHDWSVKRKLTGDAAFNEHEFMVEVSGAVSPEALHALNRPKMKVSISKQNEAITGLRFALKGYEPGDIAAQCARVSLDVIGMKRLRLGRLPMAGLAVGQWRFLMDYERF
jgi:23S rRNA pseudouridine2604 synthase